VVKTGVLAEPWSLETRHTRVDYRDVAEVAAIALTEDRLVYGAYELCSEGALDRRELAALMSEVLGRKIEAAVLPVAKAVEPFEPKRQEGMARMFDWYDSHGLLGNALVLRAILGREPRTLRAFIEELASQPHAAH
jgi:uncharacterized protein YbjT (DUF2867 family)